MSSAADERKPNILFLFSDQHHAAVLGCEHHPDMDTPNLDRLAARGTRYTRAYCQDAICGPSRISMMSGLYPRTLGIMTNGEGTSVVENTVPLADQLRRHGYDTIAIGKRHLNNGPAGCDRGWNTIHSTEFWNRTTGYDYVDWINDAGWADEVALDFAAEKDCSLPGLKTTLTKFERQPFTFRLTGLPPERTMEGYCADHTIDFLKSDRAKQNPFLCWCSFYRPHQPYTPLKSYFDKYRSDEWGDGRKAGSGIKAPESLLEPAENLPPALRYQRENGQPCWRLDLAKEDHQYYRDYIAAYYALVAEIDDHVGRILDTLEAEGLLDNTIIVYTADHGDFVGAHGMAEKCAPGHNVYEDTLRVPFMISFPGQVQAGAVRDDLVELVDLYPTLLDLAGVPQPEQDIALQGLSLTDSLVNGTPVSRSYTVSENWSQTTIVSHDYKYARMNDPGAQPKRDYRAFGEMLFERASDPLEMANRADDSSLLAEKEQMQAWLSDWESRISDHGKRERLEAMAAQST